MNIVLKQVKTVCVIWEKVMIYYPEFDTKVRKNPLQVP